MITKVCTKCGLEKDIELFVVVTRYPNGHGASCKECHNSYNNKQYYADIETSRTKSREKAKRHYHKDEEKSRNNAKQYRVDNPEQIKETDKRSRLKNKDKIAIRRKVYNQTHKDKKKQWDKTYREKHFEKIAQNKHEYYFKNKEHITQYKKEWATRNKEYMQKYKHQYYLEHAEEVKRKVKEHYENNRELINRQVVEHRKNNRQVQIAHNLRTRINQAVKGRSLGGRMREMVGCDLGTFIAHIESLWDENMGWHNYGRGKGKWSLDHIIPVEWFDLENRIERNKAFNYMNTQPMWCSENSSKSNRYSGEYKR